jgi:hypothetical protein
MSQGQSLFFTSNNFILLLLLLQHVLQKYNSKSQPIRLLKIVEN